MKNTLMCLSEVPDLKHKQNSDVDEIKRAAGNYSTSMKDCIRESDTRLNWQ